PLPRIHSELISFDYTTTKKVNKSGKKYQPTTSIPLDTVKKYPEISALISKQAREYPYPISIPWSARE
ncbi:MAG TPA: hypothetical protein PLB18_18830, partial [Acidobacteriota bacterium]|nr:hypothetical protein [Acidobacteriota bacterium]